MTVAFCPVGDFIVDRGKGRGDGSAPRFLDDKHGYWYGWYSDHVDDEGTGFGAGFAGRDIDSHDGYTSGRNHDIDTQWIQNPYFEGNGAGYGGDLAAERDTGMPNGWGTIAKFRRRRPR